MKCAAIYNIFDGVEHLQKSVSSIQNDVDLIIIIYQSVSNFGEHFDPLPAIQLVKENTICKFMYCHYTPDISKGGTWNESAKRNLGLAFAKDNNCTHFLHLDCDEVYLDFKKSKQQFMDSGADGSVCKIKTYFKSEKFVFKNLDNYYVPFIHKLNENTTTGNNKYPFYCDPTRKINCENVVLIDEPMQHYSWVRNDIKMKIRNSSARKNIEKSKLLIDYYNVNNENADGYYVKDFDNTLTILP